VRDTEKKLFLFRQHGSCFVFRDGIDAVNAQVRILNFSFVAVLQTVRFSKKLEARVFDSESRFEKKRCNVCPFFPRGTERT